MPVIREILALTLLECVTQLSGDVKVTPKICIISVHIIGELSVMSRRRKRSLRCTMRAAPGTYMTKYLEMLSFRR